MLLSGRRETIATPPKSLPLRSSKDGSVSGNCIIWPNILWDSTSITPQLQIVEPAPAGHGGIRAASLGSAPGKTRRRSVGSWRQVLQREASAAPGLVQAGIWEFDADSGFAPYGSR